MGSEQEEELETLMSIYGDKITVITQGKEYVVQLEPRLPSALQLVLKRQPVDTHQRPPSEPRSAQISHLPPVSLYVRCPPDYPALRHPECHLSAPWLDPELATAVVKKLKERFTPGNVVVFEWICYIQEDLVPEVCQLQSSPPAADDSSSKSSSVQQLFARSNSQYEDMIACDQRYSYLEFFRSAHTCDVCLRELPGESFYEPCDSCHIVVCKNCLSQSCENRVNSGLTTVMKCVKCDSVLPDTLLSRVLPPELFKRYKHLVEESQLDSIPGMVYCPRPGCNKRTVSDPKENLAVCSDCGLPFCKLCRQVYHGMGPCPVLQKVEQSASANVDDALKPAKQEPRERQIEELKSVLWMRSASNVKACPKCSFLIQKAGGCNKMHCSKCGALFCWLCVREINGYDHFNLRTCELFRSEDYLPGETGPKEVIAPDDPQLLQNLLFSNCPRCGQLESKTTQNNWIHCRKCSFQFCHLCKEACYGLWHFNEYGCTRMSSVEQDIKTFHIKP